MVNHLSGGTEILTNIERLQFADNSLALDIEGNAGEVYRLYQAAFNRPPDIEGLSYWLNQRDEGMSLEDIANHFIFSQELNRAISLRPYAFCTIRELNNSLIV